MCGKRKSHCLWNFQNPATWLQLCIFGIDKGVPIDIGLDFEEITITRLFSWERLFGSHSFPCRSLLLSTTVLNEV